MDTNRKDQLNLNELSLIDILSRVKKHTPTIPTHIPRNFFEQFSFYQKDGENRVYMFVNGQWVVLTSFTNWSEVIDDGGKPDDNADNTQDKLDLGAMIDNAKANGKTLIDGGYINTDILTADHIQTGILNIDPDNSKVEALVIKKGGDIFLEGNDTNPAKIIFRDPDNTSNKWDFYMDDGATAEFLYLLPNNLTYRDFWIGKYNASGNDNVEKTENMLRNFFVNTGNTLTGGSAPGIVFQNWHAEGNEDNGTEWGYWSSLSIGGSDDKSIVEVGGDLISKSKTIDNKYSLGDSDNGWDGVYLGNEGAYLHYNDAFSTIGTNGSTNLRTYNALYLNLSKYEPTTLEYKDHDGNNQTMQVLAYNP